MRKRFLLAVALLLTVAVPASAGLPGVYWTTIAGQKPAVLNGRWRVSFLAGGRYTVAKDGAVLVAGMGSVRGDRITFGHETGPAACRGPQATAVYRWTLRGKTLILTPISERCPGRQVVLATRPLIRR